VAARTENHGLFSGYDCVRYVQGGELTPAEQERRERVRLEAAKRFEAAELVTG
jgi:hypothetical protein